MRSHTLALLFALLPFSAACYQRADAEPSQLPAEEQHPVRVDSVFPIEEEIRRFRASLTDQPRALGQDAPRSRDELIHCFIRAIEQNDTLAATRLMITAPEFGYLYFQHSRYTEPPYKMSPALLWFLTTQESEKGLSRILATYGGGRMGIQGYRCADQPVVEGPNRIWRDCTLEMRNGQGESAPKRLFGGILERDGRYKFLSFSSDF